MPFALLVPLSRCEQLLVTIASGFFGKKSQMARRDFLTRGPRDVRDGRMVDKASGSRLTSRSRTADPEALPDGRWLKGRGRLGHAPASFDAKIMLFARSRHDLNHLGDFAGNAYPALTRTLFGKRSFPLRS
jgi:hypothetical protein